MMPKAFIIIFGILMLLLVAHERKSAKNELIVEEQEIKIEELKREIKKGNEIIKTKQNQQRIVNKSFDNINIDSRREWMQLVFTERSAAETN